MCFLIRVLVILSLAALLLRAAEDGNWPAYGHDPGGQRFSPLTTINRSNVKQLKVAWTYRTGDAYHPEHSRETAFEATPLYVDGVLYLGTPLGSVIALDPVSGKQLWRATFDVRRDAGYGDYVNRGVSTWKSPSGERRIFIATIDAHLIALDAATGKRCVSFGENGVVDLRRGLRRAPVGYADLEETSPPAVIGNTLVVGSAIADNIRANETSGEVRAFDVVTGKLKWTWDPIPQDPNAVGADTWKNGSAQKTGAANAWSIIAVDPARNLVFVPTGSPSPDYYGGERVGNNLFADSIVALRGDTGERVWHFQMVHHDLWDYDVATPPILFDIHRNGRTIPAVAVAPKAANLFILNRETGEPIFGVEERPVPKSDVPGEVAAPTQPFPLKPAPISAQHVTADEAFGIDEADRKYCHDEIAKLRTGDVFLPPSLQGSFFMPGNIGGQNWSGMTYDPVHDLLIFPTNHLGAEVKLIPAADLEATYTARGAGRLDGDWEIARQRGTPYGMMRRFLLSPKKVPCTAPPWGTLMAITASTGEKKWEVPLGQLHGLPAKFGSPSLGGPISTAGGLVFMAGTLDPAVRAFDAETGEELWKATLPTSARSTPMTFQGPDGKQYLIVCAGGHQQGGNAPLGDYVVAFSL